MYYIFATLCKLPDGINCAYDLVYNVILVAMDALVSPTTDFTWIQCFIWCRLWERTYILGPVLLLAWTAALYCVVCLRNCLTPFDRRNQALPALSAKLVWLRDAGKPLFISHIRGTAELSLKPATIWTMCPRCHGDRCHGYRNAAKITNDASKGYRMR